MRNLDEARQRMVDRQIRQRGILDANVIAAMSLIPREIFVPAGLREFAYEDSALPIEHEQTISQPYVVALILEAAGIRASDRVLEVGAGSGYVVALLSRLAAYVHGIERHAELASAATARLRKLGVRNADIQTGDGTLGLPSVARFDAIIVSAGSPDVPSCLKEQLAVGGRLVIPVGLAHNRQNLVRIIRRNDTEFDQTVISAVNFVPLVGRHGWSDSGTCGV